jgi:hypothetical protein
MKLNDIKADAIDCIDDLMGTGIHHQTHREHPAGQLASQQGRLLNGQRPRTARPQHEPYRVDPELKRAVEIG